MAHIEKSVFKVPAGVTITVGDNNLLHVKGPKGKLTEEVYKEMKISIEDGVLTVRQTPRGYKMYGNLYEFFRMLINRMVVGVTQGFTKNLDITGTGYRATKQGKNLKLSHRYFPNVIFEPQAGISFEAPTATTITVHGIDKNLVETVAALILGNVLHETF